MKQTLPARYYTDPETFRQEIEGIYCRMWVCAGRTEQVQKQGDYFLREIGDDSLIITRDRAGALRAFHNVCRHRGTRLLIEPEGSLADSIQCPYHAWTYALDGRLIGAPHMDLVPGFCKDDYPLHPVAIDAWAGHIFINLSPDPKPHGGPRPAATSGAPLGVPGAAAAPGAPLAAQLADLPEKFHAWRMHELRLVHRIVYDVKANWKLIVLNYNECLHCPVLHPLLNRLTNYLGADNDPAHSTYIGGSMGFKDGVETMSTDGKRRRDYLPGLKGSDRETVWYYVVYPNFLLSLHPDYMLTHTLWPRACDRTEIVCEWHFHPDEIGRPTFHPDDAIEFWDLTNREDWSITERSQLGIRSPAYTPGPYSTREGLLWEFDQWILERERKEPSTQ